MTIRNGLFSSESVSEGHPDKLADRISDRILDRFLAEDPKARVACETLLADQTVVLAGEFRSAREDLCERIRDEAPSIVREVIRQTGYSDADTGIDPDRCSVQVLFNSQSEDIGRGVDQTDGSIGAGDQGLMFGYACRETQELMPAPIQLAHALMRRQAAIRRSGELPFLRPDAKAQVTLRYVDRTPTEVTTVVLSTQHDESVTHAELREAVIETIIRPVIPENLRATDMVLHVNPTGRFVRGGPKGDVGLTGRKIVVDSYGGAAPHGGGAFSGKDPTKVDRSAAYMARFLARQVLVRGWAERALVQLSYAIGVADPVSIQVEDFGTSTHLEHDMSRRLREDFDLTPAGIIRFLNLERPIYFDTAAYGHFGRSDLDLPWER